MMMDYISLPYVAFFIIVVLGLGLGNIRVRGISLDVSAIIFVALLFGHLGLKMPDVLQKIGLILFIYSVGIQAGPGFFSAFKTQGVKMILIAVIVVLSGALTALVLGIILDIDFKLSVGLFAGALTSTPGLAAAIESTGSTLASIGYGIAYPFGVLGVIFFVRIAPGIFGINIKNEEEKYDREIHNIYPEIERKYFVVENRNIFGKTIGDLQIRTMTGTNISRVLHHHIASTPSSDTVLHEGDIVRGIGPKEDLKKLALLIGRETDKEISLDKKFIIRSFLVSNKNVVNKSLGELGVFERYKATATAIRRSGIDIIPGPHTKVRFGDRITMALTENTAKDVGKLLGDSRKKLNELDFLPIAIGIIIGIIIGNFTLPVFGMNFKLGLTGGVLLSALILSKTGKTGSIIWNVSGSTNQFLRRIGIIFFLVVVGTNAGGNLVGTIHEYGIKLFWIGAIITIMPMILCVLAGYFVFRLNFLTILGALSGSMTSTPALSAVEPLTESNAPQVAYATVYPFALVVLIICARIIGSL
jgi:putative transport protein